MKLWAHLGLIPERTRQGRSDWLLHNTAIQKRKLLVSVVAPNLYIYISHFSPAFLSYLACSNNVFFLL